MPEVARRQPLAAGAAGATLLPIGWPALARASSAAPPEVLAAGDLALWYDEPADTEWPRALPIGNGRLGAMVFGNVEAERLQLDEDTDDPVGSLRLFFGCGGFSQYTRMLDLTTAIASVTYVMNGVRFQREVFASAPDQVIVVRLTADRPGSLTFGATFDSPRRATLSSSDGSTIALDGNSGDTEGGAGPVRFLALAHADVTGGTVSSAGGTLRVDGATAVTLLISIGSSRVDHRTVTGDHRAMARNRLDAAKGVGFDRLRGRHLACYQALFGRVTIDLGRTAAADQPTDVRVARHATVDDPQFSALLFQFDRYLLISSAHPGSTFSGATSGVAETLLRSHDGELHLLPALPAAYPTGRVSGLRGGGGFTVDLAWNAGQVTELIIRADGDGPVRLRAGLFTATHTVVDIADGSTPPTSRLGADTVRLTARAGHTYRVTRGTTSPSCTTAAPAGASPSGGARAVYSVTSSWSGGFQGEVTVTAGSSPIKGWTVAWTFPSGQAIAKLWNGSYTQSGANVSVSNGALPARGSASFGFIANVNGTNSPPADITCTAT
jgi:hypothetical protein